MPRTPSKKFLEAGKAWRAHLAEYRRNHPNKSLKQQMKGASKTYKKGKSGSTKSGALAIKTSKYSVHVRPKSSSSKKKPKKKSKKRSSRRNIGWLW
tara:strand:+ start:370 stop:657 length:288 start_codon:yes stop_codon:yes gene_type:complete